MDSPGTAAGITTSTMNVHLSDRWRLAIFTPTLSPSPSVTPSSFIGGSGNANNCQDCFTDNKAISGFARDSSRFGHPGKRPSGTALVQLPLRIVLRDFPSCADLESTLWLSLEVSLFPRLRQFLRQDSAASAQSRSESTEANMECKAKIAKNTDERLHSGCKKAVLG